MNFKLFLCINCQKEEENDNFFTFLPKNLNGIYKNNNSNINKKYILSSSDNNSTNNLEIIEYPYSNNYIDNNYYIPELPAPEVKSNIKKNKYEYDDLLDKIKTPKLYNEVRKDNKIENNILQNKKEDERNKEIIIIDDVNGQRNISLKDSLIEKNDVIQNNKELLINFTPNYNSNLHYYPNNEQNDKNEKYNNNNNKNSNNNNRVKVDYPCPDIDNFIIKKFNGTNINNLENLEIDENYSFKDIENKNNKEKEKIFIDQKIIKKNRKEISSKTYKNVKNEKILNSNKCVKKIDKKKNGNLEEKKIFKIKLNKNKCKIKKKIKYLDNTNKNSRLITSLKIIDNNISKEGIKNEIKNRSILSKSRSRYLSNAFLGNLLLNKKNLKFRNTYENIVEKRKKNIQLNNSTNIKINNNQNKIYCSKTYINPFSLKYIKNQKNLFLEQTK